MSLLSPALWAFLLAGGGWASAALPAQASPSSAQDEYALKAQILVEVTAYVKWPPSRPEGPFVIAVIGRSPFGSLLSDYAKTHRVQGRPIEVQYWSWPKQTGTCDLVFICRSDLPWAEEILGWCSGRPVLTACESSQLIQEGAMVGLILEGGRVRIHLNRQAMTDQGFSASAQLLAAARLVGSERQTP